MSLETGRSLKMAALATWVFSGACVVGAGGGPPGGAPAATSPEEQRLVPAGYGTLRQDDFTLSLRDGPLLLKVTPLHEWVIRLAAPDTYTRLSELAAAHRPALALETGVSTPPLFLVSFFSNEPDVPFAPQDVQIESRGRRLRPAGIRAITTGWGGQRLSQRETQMAVYAYPADVDLELGLRVAYGGVMNDRWDEVLRRLEAERARVRARSGR